MVTTYLNTLARNYLSSSVYHLIPSNSSFCQTVAKVGAFLSIATLTHNIFVNGQVMTFRNLGLLAAAGVLYYLSRQVSLTSKVERFQAELLHVGVAKINQNLRAYQEKCLKLVQEYQALPKHERTPYLRQVFTALIDDPKTGSHGLLTAKSDTREISLQLLANILPVPTMPKKVAIAVNPIIPQGQNPFRRIPEVIRHEIQSFLDYPSVCQLAATSRGAYHLRDYNNFQLERRIFSQIPSFGQREWQDYWRADITSQYNPATIRIDTLRKILHAYYEPNPIGPGQVKDHILIPFVRPEKVKRKSKEEAYCPLVAEELAIHPAKGRAAKFYNNQTQALIQLGREPAGPASFNMKMRDVIARDRTPLEQRIISAWLYAETGWECPTLVDDVTGIFAHRTVTGQRAHSDGTGIEPELTYGRTTSLVRYGRNTYPAASGGHRETDGGSSPSELHVVSIDFDDRYVGAGVQRTF